MALQKQYTDRFGTTHTQAYYRVVAFTIDVDSSVGYAKVNAYKDATARNNGYAPLITMDYDFDINSSFNAIFGVTAMDNKNPIKGIYDEIKTYAEFSGATDV